MTDHFLHRLHFLQIIPINYVAMAIVMVMIIAMVIVMAMIITIAIFSPHLFLPNPELLFLLHSKYFFNFESFYYFSA